MASFIRVGNDTNGLLLNEIPTTTSNTTFKALVQDETDGEVYIRDLLLSGTNSGDNAPNSLYGSLVSNATHSGDVAGSTVLTLTTVNSNIGTYNNVTINAKGLATSGSNVNYLTSYTETDPIFTSWNKSTGISIISTQITDLDNTITNNTAMLVNTAKVSNVTHTGEVTGNTSLTISNNVVSNAKQTQVSSQIIKGRITGGTGNVEDLTAVNVRSIINVEDGANNYIHPNNDGNLHVPATSTTNNGKVLMAGATSGSISWQNVSTGTTMGGDISGLSTNATVDKIKNVAISTPSGGTSAFLNATGTWTTPSGAGDMVLANIQTISGAKSFNDSTLLLKGSTSGSTILKANATASSGTVTLPTSGILYGTEASSFSSANLLSSLSDKSGTGLNVFDTNAVLITPNLGTPSVLVGTNITGTASNLTAGTATNALSLGSIIASNYYHSGNSNRSTVNWTANNLIGNTINGITMYGPSSTLQLYPGSLLVTTGSASIIGTNTGDQTSIVGISGTTSQFNLALSDADFVTTISGKATNSALSDYATSSQNVVAGGAVTTNSGSFLNSISAYYLSGGAGSTPSFLCNDASGKIIPGYKLPVSAPTINQILASDGTSNGTKWIDQVSIGSTGNGLTKSGNVFAIGGFSQDTALALYPYNLRYQGQFGGNIFRFDPQGNFYAKGDIQAFATTNLSDIRLKQDIKHITSALTIVSKLQGSTFRFIDNPNVLRSGVIAQEIEQILPHLVKEHPDMDDESKMNKTVDYIGIIAYLIEAIKELNYKVNG